MYFPKDFRDLTIDGVIDTGALFSSISDTDFESIKQNAPEKKVLKEGPSPDFQILVANGQLEAAIATTELPFEMGYITFVERFIVLAILANPYIGLVLLQRKGKILGTRQGILYFPSFPMYSKDAKKFLHKQ